MEYLKVHLHTPVSAYKLIDEFEIIMKNTVSWAHLIFELSVVLTFVIEYSSWTFGRTKNESLIMTHKVKGGIRCNSVWLITFNTDKSAKTSY
jgi:hypothetical protein